ncbi:MAG: hypothetical protein WA152_00585 [Microgenomates group bacterium]
MAEIIGQTKSGAYILQTGWANPSLVLSSVCTNCVFFKTHCEGMVNYPQGLDTAKLKTRDEQEAKSLADKAPC